MRLERLGFFKEVNVENLPVAGTNDQIDVSLQVEEQPSGSVGASVGYAQGTGLILGANLSENNFLGTGKQVGIGFNRSTYQSSMNFSYSEPYFTVDGVSVGYNSVRSRYRLRSHQCCQLLYQHIWRRVNWSYPMSEIERIGWGLGYENLDLKLDLCLQEISDFVSDNGDNFDVVSLNVNWVKSTLNRGVFATRGTSQRVGLDIAVPGSGLEYLQDDL